MTEEEIEVNQDKLEVILSLNVSTFIFLTGDRKNYNNLNITYEEYKNKIKGIIKNTEKQSSLNEVINNIKSLKINSNKEIEEEKRRNRIIR